MAWHCFCFITLHLVNLVMLQVHNIQSRVKRVRGEETSWWHVQPEYGQQLGSPQSQAARTAAAGLVRHQTAISGVVTGYDQDGLIVEGPGFTG